MKNQFHENNKLLSSKYTWTIKCFGTTSHFTFIWLDSFMWPKKIIFVIYFLYYPRVDLNSTTNLKCAFKWDVFAYDFSHCQQTCLLGIPFILSSRGIKQKGQLHRELKIINIESTINNKLMKKIVSKLLNQIYSKANIKLTF